MSSLQKLPSDTVRLVSSSQVITSIVSIVKELVENSLDAQSDNIEVKLENHGFEKLKVRDNGTGIKAEDAVYMAQRHYTSKISQHGDLESLETYGFRGEALGSLCAMSDVTIVTKTSADDFSHMYVLDHEGYIISSKPSHLGNGTTVTATQIFKSVPVRKQYYSSIKRRRDELKKVEELLRSFGAICPNVRLSLYHNKSNIWQKNKVANHKVALINMWGSSVMSQMQHVQRLVDEDGNGQIQVEGFLPRPLVNSQSVTRAMPDRCWIAINNRPITFKEIEKMVKLAYCQAIKQETSSIRYLTMFLSITVPSHCVDVNLEPNKTKVMLQNKEDVFSVLSGLLEEVYPSNHLPAVGTTSLQQEDNIVCNTKTTTHHPMLLEDNIVCNTKTTTHHPMLLEDNIVCNTKTTTHHPMLSTDNIVCNTKTKNSHEMLLEDNTKTTTHHPMLLEDTIIPNLHDDTVTEENHSDNKEDVHEDGIRTPEIRIESLMESSPIQDSIIESCEDVPNETQDDLGSSAGSGKDEAFQLNFSIFDEDFELDDNIDSVLVNRPQEHENCSIESNTSEIASVEGSRGSISLDCMDDNPSVNKSLSLTDWSKGRGLTNKDGKVIQPATLLIPTTANREKLVTNHNAPNQLSANQDVGKSASSFQTTLVCEPRLQPQSNSGDRVRLPDSISPGGQSMTSYSPSANQKRSPGKRRLSLEKKVGKGILFDLIGQSTIRRPLSPFAFFSKEMRPQVVKKNPKANFSEITKTVEDKWEELDEEMREKYEEMGRKDEDRYQNQLKTAQKKLTADSERTQDDMPTRKKKKTSLPSNQGLIDKMLLSQQQRILANQQTASETSDIPTIDVLFSLIGLERLIETQKEARAPDEGFHLIGPIESHGVWLGCQGNELRVFNQYRVEETLLFYRLMAKHELPRQPEDIPIMLSPELLGGDNNWNMFLSSSLSSHSRPPDPAIYYTDDRLMANGFQIKQTIDSDTKEIKLQVVAMTKLINYYGIDDLKEILELIKVEPRLELGQCRPLKVTNYLKGEAVRMARSLPSNMSAQDIKNILKRMKQLPDHCQTCLHNLPFEHLLCLLP
ncbi:PMS1 protein homolog 1-like [Asterias rubens]|uniref:PMS1 protein homolog 1-like n=1 Tax=Asterias rubens TaxID=7604 RepID=UPI001455CF8D|nr:PMS1 protein homolog 1-like [Asterias rubens]XP_033639369.1 PMS1 protein homolog 1-like [Asterias rubens]